MNRKPRGYWTLENCQKDAKKYQTRKAWQIGNAGGYDAAHKKGWLDQCCGHMIELQKPHRYWTLERCQEDAKKYQTKSEWQENSAGAHAKAHRNGWLEQCCGHMISGFLLVERKWTLEACQKDALQYTTRNAWQKAGRNGGESGYNAARTKGWLDQCCRHMTVLWEKKWDLEACCEDAAKYQSKAQWKKFSPSAYGSARRNGWIDQCCEHMPIPSSKQYCDQILAPREKKWTLERCKEDAKQFQTRMQWRWGGTGGYAGAVRNGWLDQCCAHMTSPMKPHGYWTLERCQEDAKKYLSRVDWMRSENGGYQIAAKNGWLDQCCGHMKTRLWFGERTIREFLLAHDIGHIYQFRFKDSEIIKRYPYDFYLPAYDLLIEYQGQQHHPDSDGFMGYGNEKTLTNDRKKKQWAIKNKKHYLVIEDWNVNNAEEIRQLIIKKINQIRHSLGQNDIALIKRKLTHDEKRMCATISKWTLRTCKISAHQFSTKSEWKKADNSAYQAALKNGWLKKCCAHMTARYKPSGYWTLSRCQKIAKKYHTRKDWKSGDINSYAAAKRMKWLDQCCGHMTRLVAPLNYWTLENCIANARLYQTKKEWRDASGWGYSKASREGWLDQCCAHMVETDRTYKWTLEVCKNEAKKYKTRSEFAQKNRSCYYACVKKGWLDQCCVHMVNGRLMVNRNG